jgi:serine/threonine protein kinase
MKCPSCRHALHDDARFCSNCGLSTASQHTSTTDTSQQETLRYSIRPDPLIGRILDSKYELLERLGEGGMGAVYRARRVHIGDEVAVKVLHADLLVKPQAIERFRREARSAAMISHPNVVSIHDFNDAQVSGTPAYIVMEFVRGVSLHNLLRREGLLSAERTVALMRDICAGVGVAHRQGVVHRDLKPDNVIVVPAGHEGDRETAKVVDFGIAKLRDLSTEAGLTQTGAVLGTIYYMSPEQCRGEELDARADVYSLGAMLYEMLTGEPPFRANNLVGFISKHLTEAPPAFPTELGVPPALGAACHRALAKDRNERPADALALGKELQNVFAHAAAPFRQAAPLKPHILPPPGKSSWLKWTAGGLAVLFLMVVIVGTVAAYLYKVHFATNLTSSNNSSKSANEPKNDSIDSEVDERIRQGSPVLTVHDLRGTWTGTYGPLGQPAKLIIKNQKEKSFDGVLQQGEVAVTFAGTYEPNSLTLSIKQLAVLAGNSWSLGEDEGKLSADGTKMSGTGKDAVGGAFGISYQWSFSKQ